MFFNVCFQMKEKQFLKWKLHSGCVYQVDVSMRN